MKSKQQDATAHGRRLIRVLRVTREPIQVLLQTANIWWKILSSRLRREGQVIPARLLPQRDRGRCSENSPSFDRREYTVPGWFWSSFRGWKHPLWLRRVDQLAADTPWCVSFVRNWSVRESRLAIDCVDFAVVYAHKHRLIMLNDVDQIL